jgi:hypothetical protein
METLTIESITHVGVGTDTAYTRIGTIEALQYTHEVLAFDYGDPNTF